MPVSCELRAALCEQRAQDRPVAARLVVAVAADREVGGVRKLREQVDRARVVGARHLCAVLADEDLPPLRRRRLLPDLQRRDAGRQVRIPDVIPIVGGKALLRDSARRPSHGTDPQALAFCARRAELDDSNCHASRSYCAVVQTSLPLSNTTRHMPGDSWRQIELKRATTVPCGSRTGPELSASVPESS